MEMGYSSLDPTTAVDQYQPLIQHLAYRAYHTRPTFPLDVDDLVSVGMYGVWLAARRYYPRPGISFTACAHAYIRGEIRDELRRVAWAPRSLQHADTQTYEVVSLDQEVGRYADTADAPPWHERVGDSRALAAYEAADNRVLVETVLAKLPARERQLLRLHYWGGLSLAAIASHLGVSKPRVPQLHAQALRHLRAALGADSS